MTSFRGVVFGLDGRALGPEQEVPLSEMLSPKPSIERHELGGRYLRIELGMADPVTRAAIPRLELEPADPRQVKYLTPLAAVVLVT